MSEEERRIPITLVDLKTGGYVAEQCPKCKGISFQAGIVQHCCPPLVCACGRGDKEKHMTVCYQCRHEHRAERIQKAFDKAKKISLSEYKGKVCYNPEGDGGHDGNGYVFLDQYDPEDDEDDTYGWKWATTESSLTLDAADIIDNVLRDEEWFEDALDHFDTAALQQLLDTWCEEHKEVVCSQQNTRVAVLFDDMNLSRANSICHELEVLTESLTLDPACKDYVDYVGATLYSLETLLELEPKIKKAVDFLKEEHARESRKE